MRGGTNQIGWVQAAYDPDHREAGDLMAWCLECDAVYESEGDWTETNEPFAAFRVVCEKCFLDTRDAQNRMTV